MASPVIKALEECMYTGSSSKGFYWAFRHPNADAPPETYRLVRRDRNGWAQLLAASRATGQVLNFYADTPEDRKAVTEALRWFGIAGQVEVGSDGTVLKLAGGAPIPSALTGGEKPKKKQA